MSNRAIFIAGPGTLSTSTIQDLLVRGYEVAVVCPHSDPEAQTCLLHALTGFNVAFSIARFMQDFSEFRGEISLEEWAQFVVDWNLITGCLTRPIGKSLMTG